MLNKWQVWHVQFHFRFLQKQHKNGAYQCCLFHQFLEVSVWAWRYRNGTVPLRTKSVSSSEHEGHRGRLPPWRAPRAQCYPYCLHTLQGTPSLSYMDALTCSINFDFTLQGDRFSMHVIIPEQGQTLDQLLLALRNLTVDNIHRILKKSGLCCEQVKLYLPKLKIQSTLDFVEPLKKVRW